MNKKLNALAVAAVFVLFTGCSAKDTGSSYGDDIHSIIDSFNADTEQIKEKKYNNLDLSTAEFIQPEFESLHSIKITYLDGDDILSAQEMYDNVQKWSSQLFDDYDKDNIEIRMLAIWTMRTRRHRTTWNLSEQTRAMSAM